MAKIRISKRKSYREYIRSLITLSNKFRVDIRKVFDKFKKRFARDFENIQDVDNDTVQSFYDELYNTTEKNMLSIFDHMDKSIKRTRGIKQTDLTDLIPALQLYITEIVGQHITQVTQTTKDKVKKEIELGINAGLEIKTIAENIAKNNAFSLWRSTMIARTETHGAMMYAKSEFTKNLGFQRPIKVWVTSQDDRVRSWHSAMNGTVVKGNEDFKVLTPIKGGGFAELPMAYPSDDRGGASNVVNCRCHYEFIDEDDILVD
jgi:uncharacterized protein with gpF-like domain